MTIWRGPRFMEIIFLMAEFLSASGALWLSKLLFIDPCISAHAHKKKNPLITGKEQPDDIYVS